LNGYNRAYVRFLLGRSGQISHQLRRRGLPYHDSYRFLL